MQNDEDQWGVVIGNLYPEQSIPTYPCFGITKAGLFEVEKSFGFNTYIYGYFLEVAIKVTNEHNAIDKNLTFLQQESIANDLRILLIESPYSVNIPYYSYNNIDGSMVEKIGTISVVQNPLPRILANPAGESAAHPRKISANFQIEVLMTR
jgi:hypothetical protein